VQLDGLARDCGDVGQQEDLEAARKKALATGASTAYVEDLREEFVRDYVWPTLRAGAVYEHTYLLGTSMARPVIAKRQAEIALKTRPPMASPTAAPAKATIRCVRTGLQSHPRPTFRSSRRGASGTLTRAKTLSPTRKSTTCPSSRARKISTAATATSGTSATKAVNSKIPPTLRTKRCGNGSFHPEKAPDKAEEVEIGFRVRHSRLCERRKTRPVVLLNTLNEIAAKHGIGRTDLVENRLVGMKSRGGIRNSWRNPARQSASKNSSA